MDSFGFSVSPDFSRQYSLVFTGLFLHLTIFFWLFSCPAFGQVKPKLVLKESDYHKWGTLYLDSISNKGGWASFTMRYDSHPDTLFVKSANGKKQFKFVDAVNGAFGGEKWFACKSNDSLSVLNLQTGRVTLVTDIQQWSFSAGGEFLVTLIKTRGALFVWKNGNVIEERYNVSSFSHNSNGKIAYATAGTAGSAAEILDLKTLKRNVMAIMPNGIFSLFEWQPDGRGVAFMHQAPGSETGANGVYWFDVNSGTLAQVDPESLPSGTLIAAPSRSRLTVSGDGSKVFFGVEDSVKVNPFHPDSVQIWNGNDKWIYPQRKITHKMAELPVMVAWWPYENRVIKVNSAERPAMFFNGNCEYAITYTSANIGPQYTFTPVADYFLTNLKTGATVPWLCAQSTGIPGMGISPGGKYIAYHRDGSFWVYSFSESKHIKINIPGAKWTTEAYGRPVVCGIAGWGIGDEKLLLHDEHDLWSVSLPALKVVRLTNGKEQSTVYRLVNTSPLNSGMKFQRRKNAAFDMSKDLLLEVTGEKENGYALMKPGGKLVSIEKGDIQVSSAIRAREADTYVYATQRFDKPLDIKIYSGRNGSRKLYQSNAFHTDYAWGRNEIIHYKSPEGVPLKGLLYYPVNYDPAKKYPMVVNIYEIQSGFKNRYYNPSMQNTIGVNFTNLTQKGYFVLRPDIVFGKNDPGIDATRCVVAGVKAVIQKGFINPNKIGLIGHSFGGYETNFIVTHSNVFAAAVSGAGIADLQSHYLSVGWTYGYPEIFRYEDKQWRMEKSLFDDRESYERNSPVHHAHKVTTPLLIWTGDKDPQVHYSQSIAYYLALHRLGKKHMLLVYPNEGHVIVEPHNQRDLTARIHDWFGHFLKDEPPAPWIAQGTN